MAAERSGDFGTRLREARERKGVSLRQIANRTKISVAALEALERSDISRLPGGIFSRAFVRAYAAEVGLDPEATIQDFVSQFPHDSVVAGHSASDPIEDRVALESDRQVASSVLWMIAISIPLAGMVIYYSTMNRGAAATPAPPPVAAPAPDASPRSSPPPEPSAAPEATVGSTPPAPAVKTTSPTSGPVSLAAPSSLRVTSPAPTDSAAVVPERLTVGLAARRPVYVSATADGRNVIARLLQPGERAQVEVTREMVLTAGDASALTITLNGADARPLGKAGEVVSTKLTPANFKDYLQTR